MNYYDPAEHAPMYVEVEQLPPAPKPPTQSVDLDIAIHSKHVWFSQWQDKMLSLGRPVQ